MCNTQKFFVTEASVPYNHTVRLNISLISIDEIDEFSEGILLKASDFFEFN